MPSDETSPYLAHENRRRLDEVDRWRERMEMRVDRLERDVIRKMETIERTLNRLSNASEIASEVAKRIDGRRRSEFSALQKLGAGVFVIVSPLASALLARLL